MGSMWDGASSPTSGGQLRIPVISSGELERKLSLCGWMISSSQSGSNGPASTVCGLWAQMALLGTKRELQPESLFISGSNNTITSAAGDDYHIIALKRFKTCHCNMAFRNRNGTRLILVIMVLCGLLVKLHDGLFSVKSVDWVLIVTYPEVSDVSKGLSSSHTSSCTSGAARSIL